MLSAPAESIPKGDAWEYEPKWDGFRTLVFRDGDNVELVSRGARPMTRYFPEVLPAFRSLKADKLVLDGELIVVGEGGLNFGALQQRIHPADSRVRMLSAATPAWFVAFDLLAEGDADLRAEPLGERRKRLERLLKGVKPPIFITPYTRDHKTAGQWFEKFEGAGLDGVMAKSWNGAYVPGKRLWVKIKHQRTCDCVVIGWRKSNDGQSLGSLLLGLVDSMAEAFVHNHLHRHAPIFQRLSQLIGVRDRYSLIQLAVLNQRRRLRFVDIRDRRSLLIDLRITPRRGFQILPSERVNVSVNVISHPV